MWASIPFMVLTNKIIHAVQRPKSIHSNLCPSTWETAWSVVMVIRLKLQFYWNLNGHFFLKVYVSSPSGSDFMYEFLENSGLEEKS